MIEPDIARLWERAIAWRKAPWDAVRARDELRAMGLNPNAPPPEAEIRASLHGGAAAGGLPVEPEADGESVDSGTPGQARGDGVENGVGDEGPSATPAAPSRSRCGSATPAVPPSKLGEDCAAIGSGAPGQARGDDDGEVGGDIDVGDGGEAAAHPAATNLAPDQVRGSASLAPLPLAGGGGGGPDETATLPTPIRAERHNEWSRPKRVAFLRELAASQSVAQAARSVGMSRQSAYNLRNRMAGTPFSLAWEVALEAGLQQLAHAVMDRALNGEEVPLYYHGELVGHYRKYDNRLAQWLLNNPWKLGRHQVAREYAASDWDRLLERIEWASLDWEEGEPMPGRQLAAPEPDPFDDPAFDALEEPEPDPEAEAAAFDQNHFIEKRSWYAALAAEEAQRPRFGGRRGSRG